MGGIILRGDRVLLIQRAREPAKGLWSLPGGRVELGETLRQATAREILEETGLRVRVGPLSCVYERVERDADGVRHHFVVMDYVCTELGGTLRAGSDVSDARFFTLREAATLPTTEKLLVVLTRAVARATAVTASSRRYPR
ncbi:MAG: NUDIX hydrolase [Myxococcota bacterium]